MIKSVIPIALFILSTHIALSNVVFRFSLDHPSITSAGVFTGDGALIRTLWSGRKYEAGAYTADWDGLDDEGRPAAEGKYSIRVLSDQVEYTWEGVIGNNSDSLTGSTVFSGYSRISGMAFAGNTAFFCKGYSEGSLSYAKFDIRHPRQKQWLNYHPQMTLTTSFVTTDGVNVYWVNIDPPANSNSFIFSTLVRNDSDVVFSKGAEYRSKWGILFTNVIDYVNAAGGEPTGIAVERKGRYLLVSHGGLNQIHIIDKYTGGLVRIETMDHPGYMATDASDDVWICSGDSGAASIKKFKVSSDGRLSAPVLSLGSQIIPLALSVSPDDKTVIVADKTTQQLKAFSNQTGGPLWSLGEPVGYDKDPTVRSDKFYFSDQRASLAKDIRTFITFQPDGSFWVGDPGNARVLHFSQMGKYIDQIMYLPGFYSCGADPNDPTRVFADYLEFKIDYSKPLSPDNGSWTLVKNWGAIIPSRLDDHYNRLAAVTTLSNGHTYALLHEMDKQPAAWQLVELPAEGPLRLTGIEVRGFPTTRLYEDGSLRATTRLIIGKPTVWTKRGLTGFDKMNNPAWSAEDTLAWSPPATREDPGYWGAGFIRPVEITSSGIIIAFDAGVPPHGGDEYHLGGIRVGSHKWLWRTADVTNKNYSGDFPADGSFDIGNGVKYAGSIQLVNGHNILWGYHGEFWKDNQTNKWNHFRDDGLFVGQLGPTGLADTSTAAPGMTGNALSAALVKANGEDLYLYHNDEGGHGGVHRWKITGLNTIREETVAVVLAKGSGGSSSGASPATDLMQGLPNNSTLENGLYGWTRSPQTEDSTSTYSKWWEVHTSIKTSDKWASPDVYIRFRQKQGTAQVSRDLGNTATPLSNWKLSGLVDYEGNLPNDGNDVMDKAGGGMYLDVLDDKGKILIRVYSISVRYKIDTRLYVNDRSLLQSDLIQFMKTTGRPQPMTLAYANGGLTFRYGNLSPVNISPFDPSADPGHPKQMRLYFWGNSSNHERIVDLQDFHFIQ